LRWDGKAHLIIPALCLRFQARVTEAKYLPPFDDEQRTRLNPALICWPLIVRIRRAVDCYQPIGGPNAGKLKDVMNARKFPCFPRLFLPVFHSGDEVAWIPGCPVAAAFKVDDHIGRVLIIEKI
jgi:hypothetical protein